jgi:amidase
MAGADHIIPVIGPLSTSLGGVKLFMKTLIDAQPWLHEASLLPFPWKEELTNFAYLRKLKIAVLWDDGVVRPHPPVTRALKEVSEKLQKLPGVEVVEWKPYKHDEAWSIITSLYFVDGAADETKALDESGEPWMPLSKHIIKDNEFVKRHSIEDLWYWQNKRETYRSEYSKIWNETGFDEAGNQTNCVDAILCPVGPGAAPLLNTAKWWGYTSQWNLLDYPGLVFPVTKADPQVDVIDQEYKPRNSKDEYNWNNCKFSIYQRTG